MKDKERWTPELVGQAAWNPELWQTCGKLREFAANEPEQTSLLGPFKRSQVGWLAAPPGAGKSMFALALAGAISMGWDFGPWTGHGNIAKSRIVDAELTARDLLGRITVLGHEGSMMEYDHYGQRAALDLNGFRLGHPDDQDYLMHTCKESTTIVIDNVTFTLDPAPGHNMYSPETIQQMRPLFNWAKATGKLLIMVDHTNSEGKLAGSLNKQRLADWVVYLEPDSLMGDMELAFTLKWDKYRGEGRPKHEHAFSMDALGKWTHSEIIPLPEQILELLQGGATHKDVMQDLGCTPDQVKSVSRKRGGR
jgi:hypothetical protein